MILKCLLLWLGKEYKGEKKESQSILDLEKVKKKRVQGSSHCDQIGKKCIDACMIKNKDSKIPSKHQFETRVQIWIQLT